MSIGTHGSSNSILSISIIAFCLAVGAAGADVTINATNFPDANFRSWLLEQDYGVDGVITDEEIADIRYIDVNNKNIESLVGIEHFVNLKQLLCRNNQLTSLSILGLTELSTLHCNDNQLTSLNVTALPQLKTLWCHDNQLASLNVSTLTDLNCGYNQLTSLDVSALTGLNRLNCDRNNMASESAVVGFNSWDNMSRFEPQNEVSISHIVSAKQSSNRPQLTFRGRVLNIRAPSQTSSYSVRLIDMRGKSIVSFNAVGNSEFSLAKIPAGRYLAEVRGGGKREKVSAVVGVR